MTCSSLGHTSGQRPYRRIRPERGARDPQGRAAPVASPALAACAALACDDDKLQPLTSFASENIPLELVTAIDVSSSMQDALPAVKRQATEFLAQLQPSDQVTVI